MAPWVSQLTEYRLGIMSSEWLVKAYNPDIAVCTIMLHAMTDAPIAIYGPMGEHSKFQFKDKYTAEELNKFLDENKDAIKAAYSTITLI